MDVYTKSFFYLIGIEINELHDLDNIFISRDMLLSINKYNEIKTIIPELKKIYSSSFMTGLQQNAEQSQKWPLLNIVRQILNVYGYKMFPIRKADGYTLKGVKKYKRFFILKTKY